MTRVEAINYFKESMAIGEDDDIRHHNEVLEFTIKTLEQEPCEDAVSRKAMLDAITEIDDNINMDIYTNEVREIIDELPSVTPKKNGWIPCSERLPEYGEVVMCSCTNNGITISCITYKGVKPSKSARFGQHSVIAWMPLPEPYKE